VLVSSFSLRVNADSEIDNAKLVTCIISGTGVLAGVTGGGNFFMKSIGFSSAVCWKKR
jgi:hypothetical protein